MKLRLMIGLAVALSAGLVLAAAPSRTADPASAPSLASGTSTSGGMNAVPADPAAASATTGTTRAPTLLENAAPSEGSGTPGTSGDHDLRTYAFATQDLATIQAALGTLAGHSQSLTSAADSFSLAAVRTAGETLGADAAELLRTAEAASARMISLVPSSAALADVRQRALTAYTLTADHARAGHKLAEFAISLDLSQAGSVAEAIDALQQGGDGLFSAYEALASGLGSWSDGNPAAAQHALATYT